MDTVTAITECPTHSEAFKHYLELASGAQLEDAIARTKAKGGQKVRLKLLEAKREELR